MRFNILTIILTILIAISCQKKEDDFLIKIYKGEIDEVGVESGYRNQAGDTIIPIGKYQYCYTDTLKAFAIVLEKSGKLIGIDRNENKLFDVFWFDNGPDYVAEGLFRIKQADKIGYANQKGEIVIAPQYACAFPFENGKAKVAYDCTTIADGEHSSWESKKWLFIDIKGNKTVE